jgi:hypothetical protein
MYWYYWYILYPIHVLIFRGLIRTLAHQATELGKDSKSDPNRLPGTRAIA